MGLFFSSPASRAPQPQPLPISNLVSFYRQSWGSISYRRTYRPFLFHLFCFRELATRFLLLVPAPPPSLAAASTRPLPFSLFHSPPRSSVVVVVVVFLLEPRSLDHPLDVSAPSERPAAALSISPVELLRGAGKVGEGRSGGKQA